MAILLEANYSKKLGLPEFSSHQYSVSIRSELQDLTQVPEESARLYHLLQDSVDSKIQESGYLPSVSHQKASGSAHSAPTRTSQAPKPWNCSEKQEKLIRDLMKEHKLPDEDIDELSCSMFDKQLAQLNKLEASGLIDELFRQYGKPKPAGSRSGSQSQPYRGNSRYSGGGR